MFLISSCLNKMHLFALCRYRVKRKIHKNKWGKSLVRTYCPSQANDPLPPKPVQYFEIEFISLYPVYRVLFVGFSAVALGTWGYWYCCCLLYVFFEFTVLYDVSTALSRSGENWSVWTYIVVTLSKGLCAKVCL